MRFKVECVYESKPKDIYEKYPKLKEMKNLVVRDNKLYLFTSKLEQLLELKEKTGENIIITNVYDYDRQKMSDELMIEIYDTWRE